MRSHATAPALRGGWPAPSRLDCPWITEIARIIPELWKFRDQVTERAWPAGPPAAAAAARRRWPAAGPAEMSALAVMTI